MKTFFVTYFRIRREGVFERELVPGGESPVERDIYTSLFSPGSSFCGRILRFGYTTRSGSVGPSVLYPNTQPPLQLPPLQTTESSGQNRELVVRGPRRSQGSRGRRSCLPVVGGGKNRVLVIVSLLYHFFVCSYTEEYKVCNTNYQMYLQNKLYDTIFFITPFILSI